MSTETVAIADGLRHMLGRDADALPLDAQAAVWDRFGEVVVEYVDHGRVDPLLDFVRSLAVTARLYRNPDYLEALAKADAQPPRDGADVEDVLAAHGYTRSR